jgi:hypothetical protein
MSVNNYHSTLRNIPQQRRCQSAIISPNSNNGFVFVIETVSVDCEVGTDGLDSFVGEVQASNGESFACGGEDEETTERQRLERKETGSIGSASALIPSQGYCFIRASSCPLLAANPPLTASSSPLDWIPN